MSITIRGVYVTTGEWLRFRRVPPPTVAALEKLVRVISERVGRVLERQGLLVRDLGVQLSDLLLALITAFVLWKFKKSSEPIMILIAAAVGLIAYPLRAAVPSLP